MILGLGGALLAAFAYGVGTILQALGVREMAALPTGSRLATRIRAGWLYALGLLIDGVGFLASILALRTLPLFLVESAVASSVAVTAAFSVWVLHIRLSRPEVLALAGIALGLASMAAAAQDGPATAVGGPAGWLLLGAALAVGGLLVWGLFDKHRQRASIVLSATAGLGFGLLGVAARLLVVPEAWWRTVADPTFWALLAGSVIGLVSYGYALDRGRVTTVAAVTFAVETVVPAIIGLLWLGDAVRPRLWVLAIFGFALTLGSCMTLASRAEPPVAEPTLRLTTEEQL